MNTTPKRLVKLAKELAHRRYMFRVHDKLGDRVLSQRAAFAARQIKAKLDHYTARHAARAMARLAQSRLAG